jgi:hypothetical protein
MTLSKPELIGFRVYMIVQCRLCYQTLLLLLYSSIAMTSPHVFLSLSFPLSALCNQDRVDFLSLRGLHIDQGRGVLKY